MHARHQIREAVAGQLTGLATSGARVYANRLYDLPADTQPNLSIFTGSESAVDNFDALDSDSFRSLTVVVEARIKAVAGVDAALDTMCAEIENAISSDQTIGGAVKNIEYQGSEIGFDSESEKPIGLARLTYRALYRVNPINSNQIIQ